MAPNPEPGSSRSVKTRNPTTQRSIARPSPSTPLAQYVSELGNANNEQGIRAAEVLLPREILRGPVAHRLTRRGRDGFSACAHHAVSAGIRPCVVLPSGCITEYTEPEMQLFRHAMRVSPNVAAVLAKTIFTEWRAIKKIDRNHLKELVRYRCSLSSDLRLSLPRTKRTQRRTDSPLNGTCAPTSWGQ